MTQRYNVPANHTATFSEILTENYSHSPQSSRGISNAADRRPQTADRRPQTADRRPDIYNVKLELTIPPARSQLYRVIDISFDRRNSYPTPHLLPRPLDKCLYLFLYHKRYNHCN